MHHSHWVTQKVTHKNTMKKILSIVALSVMLVGAAFADSKSKTSNWTDSLSMHSSVGFESEYVFRGRNLAHNVTVWTLEGSYKLYNGSLYAGATGFNGQQHNYTETDFYVGYKMPLHEKFSADFGFTYYWFSNQDLSPSIDRTYEIYAGLMYNGWVVNPAVYVYYDFALERWTGELSGKYSWDLAKYGWARTSLDVGAFVGTVSADDADSDQVAGDTSNGYNYAGVTADLVYAFNKNASASVGIRYIRNDDDAQTGGELFDREESFGWGAKFSAGF